MEKETPFAPGEIFNAKEEIATIASESPHSRERLAEYKEKLVYQMRGLTKMEAKVVSKVEKNPRIDIHVLQDYVNNRMDQLALTPEQRTHANDLLDKFMTRHQALVEIYDTHRGNAAAIFEDVFSAKPAGKVEVVLGPSLLYFRCFDAKDYALIVSEKYRTGEKVHREDMRQASMSGGQFLWDANDEKIAGGIAVENAAYKGWKPAHSIEIYEHEKRHMLNALFMKPNKIVFEAELIMNAETPEEKKYWLEQYMRNLRSGYEHRTANEILAFLKQGEGANRTVYYLTQPGNKGGLYDYYAYWLKDIERGGKSLTAQMATFMGENDRATIEPAIHKVFDVEYHALIKRGVRAVERLTKNGYSADEAASILGRTELRQWPKISRRLTGEPTPKPEDQFPLYDFHLYPRDFVVAVDKRGTLRGELRYVGINGENNAVCETPAGEITGDLRDLKVKDLEELNYPFKTADTWFKVWLRSGGDKSVKNKLGFDYRSQEEIPASEAWKKFRSFCPPISNPAHVFNTLQRHQDRL